MHQLGNEVKKTIYRFSFLCNYTTFTNTKPCSHSCIGEQGLLAFIPASPLLQAYSAIDSSFPLVGWSLSDVSRFSLPKGRKRKLELPLPPSGLVADKGAVCLFCAACLKAVVTGCAASSPLVTLPVRLLNVGGLPPTPAPTCTGAADVLCCGVITLNSLLRMRRAIAIDAP